MYFKSLISTSFVVLLTSFAQGQTMQSMPGPVVICPPAEFSGLHHTAAHQGILDRMNSLDLSF